MAIYKNSAPFGSIVTDGLVLNLDATNINSYPGSGTTWTDTSGYNNSGTLTNGPTFLRERGRGSIVFDGVDDYVSRNQALDTGQNFTVSSWIYPTLLGTTRRAIVGNSYNYSSRNGWFFSTAGFGNNNTFFLSIGTDSAYRVAAANTLSLNMWQYITGVVADGGQTITLYLNGNSTNSATSNTNSGTITYTSNQFNIGVRFVGSTLDPYTGNIAITQIYNRALSQQEVQQNFNALKSRFGL
jgi:hypothetical protein